MSNIKIAIATIAALACIGAFGDIVGSYTIEVDLEDSGVEAERTANRVKPTLTISVSDEGDYLAELSGGLVGDIDADRVDIVKNEFSITFEIDVRGGTFTMTYSGKVEEGEMSGTFSSGMGDFEFSGKLKEKDETKSKDESEVDESVDENGRVAT